VIKLELDRTNWYHVLNNTLQDCLWPDSDTRSDSILVCKYCRSSLRMIMHGWHALPESIRTIISTDNMTHRIRSWYIYIYNVEWQHESQMNKQFKTYVWEDTSQADCQFVESSMNRWLSATIEYFRWFSYPIYSILRSIFAILFDTILNFRSECRFRDTMWRNPWTWLKPVVVAFISMSSSSYSDLSIIGR
jgi:hypothetical protein